MNSDLMMLLGRGLFIVLRSHGMSHKLCHHYITLLVYIRVLLGYNKRGPIISTILVHRRLCNCTEPIKSISNILIQYRRPIG